MSKLAKKELLILLIIILFGAVFRFWHLSEYSIHLSHDEITQLYDAISIAQTGKDIYGNFLPTIFVSINDYKPPFYTYITSLVYMIVGWQEIAIRIPGALGGVLLIFAVFWFVKSLCKDKNIALIAAFFTAITPFEIFFSRKSFEGVIGIFFMLTGFTFLLQYVDQKRMKFIYIAAFSLAFAMYTYFSHAVLIPIVLAAFLMIFKKSFGQEVKTYLLPLLTFVLLLIPLSLIILLNPDSRNRSQAVFITQDIGLQKQLDLLGAGSPFVEKLYYVKTLAEYSFGRYLQQFDIMYLFGNGLGFTNQGPLDLGIFYPVQLPLLILGLVYLIKKTNIPRQKLFVSAWIVLGMIPSGLTFELHSAHRSLMVFTMLNVIAALGMHKLIKLIQALDNKLFRGASYGIMTIGFSIGFVYFAHMYLVNHSFEKSEFMHYPFKQISLYAWSEYDNYEQIVLDPLYGEHSPTIGAGTHYYLAFYGKYPPQSLQKEFRKGDKERETLFGKFSIRKVDWGKDQDLKDSLVIASSWSLPINDLDKGRVVKTFYFYNGKPAFYAISLR